MNAALSDPSDILSVRVSFIFHFQLESRRFLGGFASGIGRLFAISAAKPPSRPHATTEINARNSSIRLRAFSEPSGSSAQRAAASDSFGTRGDRCLVGLAHVGLFGARAHNPSAEGHTLRSSFSLATRS